MHADRNGNPVSGATPEALEAYEQAVRAFNIYRGDPVALVEQAIEAAPGFALARILKGYLFGLATEPAGNTEAQGVLSALSKLPLNDRERAHRTALEHLLAGNWTDAALTLDRLSMLWPRDLVALQAGHLMDFYRASARGLRDRIARALPQWSEADAGYSILLGMLAFGLEECGDYARAEDTARRALDLEPLDCWAHHAVAHVMEMQGRAQDGVGWMITREPHWSGDDNFFRVHNWWHRALCHLDLGETGQVLALYDGPIRSGRSDVALDMVDASALLWRLHLVGADVGDRWQELASAWDAHADGRTYAFNDWHAVMAYLGAGRGSDIERVLAQMKRDDAGSSDSARWARRIGVPLIEGFVAFWRDDHATAVDRLHAARHIVNAFGGSHAQRDVIDWTLIEAAGRGGNREVARALANERLHLKPHSPVNRQFLARGTAGVGASPRAA